MAIENLPKIISAELLRGGILITFSNGDEGLYSDELLHASLPAARALLARIPKTADDGEPL